MKRLLVVLFLVASFCYSQFSLNAERIGGAMHAGENNLFRVSLINDGKIIHTIEQKIPFDVPFPASYVDEKRGTIILTNAFDGFVEVYNANGKKIWKQNFFKGMGPNYERTITVALGSSTIAFLTSDVTLPNAKVHQYTVSGTKEWETSLPYSLGNAIVISGDGQTIIAGSYVMQDNVLRRSSTLLNSRGVIEGNADILFRSAAFSDDNAFIALISEREIAVISGETKKEISRAGRMSEGIITDVIWNGDTLIVQESEVTTSPDHAFNFSDPTFVWYNNNLKEIMHKKIELPSFKTSALRKKGSEIELNTNGTAIPVTRLK